MKYFTMSKSFLAVITPLCTYEKFFIDFLCSRDKKVLDTHKEDDILLSTKIAHFDPSGHGGF